MKISDLSIRRPVLASMLSLALVLFGAIGYTQLSVREFPDVDPPVISVSTFLPGANPQVVESAVTDILEEELSTVQGIRTLTSSSAEQFSNITIEFNLERKVEDAAQDVRDKVSRVRGRLPQDIEEPIIAKQEADASPIMWLALSGANYDLLQLSDIADRIVKNRLQSAPGVGNIIIGGERRYSMRVWLSAPQLAARGLTVQDVEEAIRSRNVEIPAGRIESNRREFTVRSLGELKTPEEFSELVVPLYVAGRAVGRPERRGACPQPRPRRLGSRRDSPAHRADPPSAPPPPAGPTIARRRPCATTRPTRHRSSRRTESQSRQGPRRTLRRLKG